MTKSTAAQAISFVLALIVTVSTVAGVDALATRQASAAQTLAQAGPVQTVVVIGRRVAKT